MWLKTWAHVTKCTRSWHRGTLKYSMSPKRDKINVFTLFEIRVFHGTLIPWGIMIHTEYTWSVNGGSVGIQHLLVTPRILTMAHKRKPTRYVQRFSSVFRILEEIGKSFRNSTRSDFIYSNTWCSFSFSCKFVFPEPTWHVIESRKQIWKSSCILLSQALERLSLMENNTTLAIFLFCFEKNSSISLTCHVC